jgi:nucleotide-binding universal stress UspA family protein
MKIMVAFASPKRSAKVVEAAAKHAVRDDAELVLVRVMPDPEKLGVVAQLVTTQRPQDKAQAQIDQVVANLLQQGVKATGVVKIGAVSKTLCDTAKELNADMLYVGSTTAKAKAFYLTVQDPIVHYLLDNCPVSLCIIRHDVPKDTEES